MSDPTPPTLRSAALVPVTPFRLTWWFWTWYLLLVSALAFGDAYTTQVVLDEHLGGEANPTAAHVFTLIGHHTGTQLFAVGFVALMAGLLWVGSRTRYRAVRLGCLGAVVVVLIGKTIVVLNGVWVAADLVSPFQFPPFA